MVTAILCCTVSQNAKADWEYVSIDNTNSINILVSTNMPPEPSVSPDSLLPSTVASSPAIDALAGALGHDPLQAYNYVRNHIERSPLYGVRNGAAGCLAAGHGTDADQACLLYALLVDGTYDVRLRKAIVFYEKSTLVSWYGVDNDESVVQALNGSGNAAYHAEPTYPAWRGLVRMWVEIHIDGTWYKLDPAYTAFDDHAGVDLAAACGFNLDTFMSAALTGASYDSNHVQDVDAGVINSNLATYSSNLKSYLEANAPNGSLAQVLGGRSVRKSQLSALSTTLPDAQYIHGEAPWTPEAESVQINIQHKGINQTIYSHQIPGKRISITYDASNGYRPVLRVGGDAIQTGNTSTPGTTNDLTISVNHPYLYNNASGADKSYTLKLRSGDTYLLVHDMSRASRGSIASANRLLGSYFIDELALTGESITGESMFAVMESGLTQWAGTQKSIADLCDIMIFPHHFSV